MTLKTRINDDMKTAMKAKEAQRLEFRLEASNATNTPIFSDPSNNNFGNANFGVINSTKVGARNVQLGFKYYF